MLKSIKFVTCQRISDLHISPSYLKIFFRAWKKNAARLFFSVSDAIFATLVKFFVEFYTSLMFLLKPFYISYLC